MHHYFRMPLCLFSLSFLFSIHALSMTLDDALANQPQRHLELNRFEKNQIISIKTQKGYKTLLISKEYLLDSYVAHKLNPQGNFNTKQQKFFRLSEQNENVGMITRHIDGFSAGSEVCGYHRGYYLYGIMRVVFSNGSGIVEWSEEGSKQKQFYIETVPLSKLTIISHKKADIELPSAAANDVEDSVFSYSSSKISLSHQSPSPVLEIAAEANAPLPFSPLFSVFTLPLASSSSPVKEIKSIRRKLPDDPLTSLSPLLHQKRSVENPYFQLRDENIKPEVIYFYDALKSRPLSMVNYRGRQNCQIYSARFQDSHFFTIYDAEVGKNLFILDDLGFFREKFISSWQIKLIQKAAEKNGQLQEVGSIIGTMKGFQKGDKVIAISQDLTPIYAEVVLVFCNKTALIKYEDSRRVDSPFFYETVLVDQLTHHPEK